MSGWVNQNPYLFSGLCTIIVALISVLATIVIERRKAENKAVKELQQENNALKKEIEKLNDYSVIKEKIKRHTQSYVTLIDDEDETMYCSCCWDKNHVLIQVSLNANGWQFNCPNSECNNYGQYYKNRNIPNA